MGAIPWQPHPYPIRLQDAVAVDREGGKAQKQQPINHATPRRCARQSMPLRWHERQQESCGPRNVPERSRVSPCFVLVGQIVKRTCFLSLITLKRSKSVNCLRFADCALLLAHALPSHFCSTSAFSQAVFSAPLPMPRGILRTTGVRETSARGVACRGTNDSGLAAGPSTRTLYWLVPHVAPGGGW